MRKRVEFTMKFTADLDGVPGTFHDHIDWINMVKADILRQTHYNTTAELIDLSVSIHD